MDPRPAATVVVARAASTGIEVLVLTRGPGTTFAPGFRVFPGGMVDPEDAELAELLFDDRAQAPRACALRELHEETGILLTDDGPVLEDVLDPEAFEPPSASAMPEIGHWIAPEFLEVRFDARFFAAAAPPGMEPEVDGHEIEAAEWLPPLEVLRAADRGDRPLMWPTLVTLQRLAECRSTAEVLALRVEQVPRPTRDAGPSRSAR